MSMSTDRTVLIFDPTYFTEALQPDLNPLITQAERCLEGVDYDTMVGTGLSGALAVPILARALRKHWFIVRYAPSAHDFELGVGRLGQRWLFVDDFIASGNTFWKVMDTVNHVKARYADYSPRKPVFRTTLVGAYLYQRGEYRRPVNLPKPMKVRP